MSVSDGVHDRIINDFGVCAYKYEFTLTLYTNYGCIMYLLGFKETVEKVVRPEPAWFPTEKYRIYPKPLLLG